jgi:hypothetical protein
MSELAGIAHFQDGFLNRRQHELIAIYASAPTVAPIEPARIVTSCRRGSRRIRKSRATKWAISTRRKPDEQIMEALFIGAYFNLMVRMADAFGLPDPSMIGAESHLKTSNAQDPLALRTRRAHRARDCVRVPPVRAVAPQMVRSGKRRCRASGPARSRV